MTPSFLPRGLAAPAYGAATRTVRPEWEGALQPEADPMMELIMALQAQQGAPAGVPKRAAPRPSTPQPSAPSWNLPSMTGRMRAGGMAGGVGGGA